MKKLSIVAVSMLFALHAHAAGSNANGIYLGGGIGFNEIDGYGDNDATGFQIFGGMPIPVSMGKAALLGEVGYMDSGDFDHGGSAEGLWANAVIELPVAKKVDLLGRLGLDFGDDDGLMIGGGVGIALSNKVDLRFEYVIRDDIDSLQANIAIGL